MIAFAWGEGVLEGRGGIADTIIAPPTSSSLSSRFTSICDSGHAHWYFLFLSSGP